GDAIGGVAWGDFGLKFTTTDAQLTLNSPWTYNTANTVNFSQSWTATTNAEMGIVQTKPGDNQMGYPDRVVGNERGSTSVAGPFANCAGFGDARVYSVPCVSGWPYQMMNFDWDPTSGKDPNEATGTKLMAWGSPYGWLGASDAGLFGSPGTVDARGDRSYATFIVLGPHCRFAAGACDQDGDVAIVVKAVEALGAATITAVGPGTLVTQVPRGPGAIQTKTIANGYNDTYAAYYLSAAANHVAFTFTPAVGKPVKNPMFVIQNWTLAEIPVLSVVGTPVTINDGTATSGAFVSFNQTTNELWITLNRTLNAATAITVSP
ncbi:MAG TPA: hypothetical protein VE034_00865, partial [Burkholderiales bacterium]|nr:hypothetical protein [Burkholderiales bacterium]